MRQMIASSLDLKEFNPQDKESWDKAYEKYLEVTK